MVALEKVCIPTVGIVARSFVRAWQSCVDGWGQRGAAFVTIPHATTGQTVEFIHAMVDEQIDAVISGLTAPTVHPSLPAAAKSSEIHTVEIDDTPEGLNAVNRFFEARDLSDGLPVVPPTPAAVERLLKATRRDPQEVLMVMEPGFGLATVEKIAINAVMAGCGPEQFPVLLAAIACLAQPQMNHRDMQVSGHAESPLILVNGPAASRAGLNVGLTAMGPGVVNRANTAIGRALRLCLINIGNCKPGSGDPNFIGLPAKFGMCLAENEEASPWPPYHVDQGYRREQSAVTVAIVTGPADIIDSRSKTAVDTMQNIGSMMSYRNAGAGTWVRERPSAQIGNTDEKTYYHGPYHPIILSPTRAVTLAQAGMSKQDVQAWLHAHCRVRLRDITGHGTVLGLHNMPKDPGGRWINHPELQMLEQDPEATVPALERQEQYLLFVSGGSTHCGHFFYGTYGIATQPVEEE